MATKRKKAKGKTTKRKTAKRKTTARKTTAKKTTRRRKARTPSIAAHGKTAAQRRKYIEYLGAKKKLVKEYFG